MNFLFRSADVPRALPEANPASVEVRSRGQALNTAGRYGLQDTVPDSDGPETETPELPAFSFTQKPRPKPKATG